MVFFFSLFYAKTPKIKDEQGKVKPNSIASLEKVILGGIDQAILIRGHNTQNPLLLMLHGGPGVPEMPFAYKFDRKLEEYFTVVNWDQRGSGKSFSKRIPKETMTIEQFLSDTLELIQLLRERFDKDKIYIVGHSWGTVLGLLLAQRHPELLHAFIGIGQVVNLLENEQISLEFVRSVAKEKGNKKAIKQLAVIELPYGNNIKDMRVQRKWLYKYGGFLYGKTGLWPLFKIGFGSPEYSLRDFFKFLKGVDFSLDTMWSEVQETNFFETIPEVSVPVYFCVGRYDYNTPYELVERYYNQLKAPQKKLIWFENSAHCPNFEEREKFDDVMISIVLPETYIKE